MTTATTPDLTTELARLIAFTAEVATAIRMNSPYNGQYDRENPQHGYDVMWLADSLHNFLMLGQAIEGGDANAIAFACDMLTDSYDRYGHPPGDARVKGDPQGAFARHRQHFALEEGRTIFADIKAKVLPAADLP